MESMAGVIKPDQPRPGDFLVKIVLELGVGEFIISPGEEPAGKLDFCYPVDQVECVTLHRNRYRCSSCLNFPAGDSLHEGLGIFRGRAKPRFIDHRDSLRRTAGGANGTSETAIQVDLGRAVISQCQCYGWASVETNAAGRT